MEAGSLSNLSNLLITSFSRNPQREALVYFGQNISYLELEQHIRIVVEVLKKFGIKTGNKVALLLPNGPFFVVVSLAIFKLGGVVCPLNISLTKRELEELIHLIEPDCAIVTALPKELLDHLSLQLPILEYAEGELIPSRNGIEPRDQEYELRDVALILCTSGTTGLPKAGMLTHANLIANLNAFKDHLCRWPENNWLEHEIFGNVIPLFHPYGLIMMTLMPLFLNGTVVLMPDFTPGGCLKCIQTEKITFFGGVPSMYAMLNKYRHKHLYDYSSCRYWISGGAPLPDSVRQEFTRAYNAYICEGFGMLETSSLASLNFGPPCLKPGSAGPFIKEMRAQIRDEYGKEVEDGEIGELWVQGPNIMKGYYRNESATSESIQNKWLKTGDLGFLDRDKFLYLKGRVKELIIVSGHNIYPREIETVLLEHPSIADAAITSREDNVRGEEILAFVVPLSGHKIDEKELFNYCREQLSLYKVPRTFYVVNEIPRNAAGKILRDQLNTEAMLND